LLASGGCGSRGKAREQGLGVAVADRGLVVGGQAVGGVQRGGKGGGDAVVAGESVPNRM
jgi:hypothetical protein